MLAEEIEVQMRQQVAGMIAADGRLFVARVFLGDGANFRD